MWIFPALVWLNQHIWIFNIIKLPRSFQAETITNKKGFKVSGHKMFAHKVFRIEKYHHLNLHMAQLLKNVRRVGLLFLKETKKVILRGKSAPFDSWGLVNFSVIWKKFPDLDYWRFRRFFIFPRKCKAHFSHNNWNIFSLNSQLTSIALYCLVKKYQEHLWKR